MVTDTHVNSHVEFEMGISLDADTCDTRTGRVGTTAGIIIVTKAEGFRDTWLIRGTLPAITAYLMDHVADDFVDVIELLANAYTVEEG